MDRILSNQTLELYQPYLKSNYPWSKSKPLFEKYIETKDISIRDDLVLNNLKLVYREATKVYFNDSSVDFDDIIQDGILSLIKAIDTFDPSKGFTFSTYATMVIRNNYFLKLRKTIKITTPDGVNRIISLNEPLDIDEDEPGELISQISCPIDCENEVIVKILMDKIYEIIETLPPYMKSTIITYYGLCGCDEYNMSEIANAQLVTRAAISLRIIRSLKKIRAELGLEN